MMETIWKVDTEETYLNIVKAIYNQPTAVLLSGKSHGWRSLVDYSPQSRKESDMTERLTHTHTHTHPHTHTITFNEIIWKRIYN